jgi:hypothetical protein
MLGGLTFSDCKKAEEALADSLEAQFQPVNDLPDLLVNEALHAYSMHPQMN